MVDLVILQETVNAFVEICVLSERRSQGKTDRIFLESEVFCVTSTVWLRY